MQTSELGAKKPSKFSICSSSHFVVKKLFVGTIRVSESERGVAMRIGYSDDEEGAIKFCTRAAAYTVLAAIELHNVTGLSVVEVQQ